MQTPGNIEKQNELLHWQSRVERIKKYVLANLAADLGTGTVADKFGLKEPTLRRLFRETENESFHAYVERVRMTKALQLLAEGKWVKEVITAVGYKNKCTFNNAFKKRFKQSARFFKK